MEFGKTTSDDGGDWLAEQRRKWNVENPREEPELEPDENLLLANFMVLHRTRPPAFAGISPLDLPGVVALYEAEAWWEGGHSLMDFCALMLGLDDAARKFINDRSPAGRN